MATPTQSPLAFLQGHFDALEPRIEQIPGLPFKLAFAPLNAEQSLKLSKALREKITTLQANAYAELLMETVTLEDGKKAFELVKGGPNPVEILTKHTKPRVFTAMVNILIDWITAEADELEKK